MTRLPRIHQRYATGGTAGDLPTVTTDEGAGIALAVEKQQHAGPATDRFPDSSHERLAQYGAPTIIV